jgi:hypothetical protein
MATSAQPVVVVFVPGITGTSLRNPADVQDVWYEQIGENVLLHGGDDVISLMTQAGLVPGQPLQSVLNDVQVYRPLIDYFQSAPDGSNNGYSVYDPSSAVYQLLVNAVPNGFAAPEASLSSATQFWAKLNYTGAVPYYVAFGSGLATVENFLYDSTQPTPVLQLAPQDNTTQGGGDGTVPEWSTDLAGAAASYNAGPVTHGGIVTDPATLEQINAWITGTASLKE